MAGQADQAPSSIADVAALLDSDASADAPVSREQAEAGIDNAAPRRQAPQQRQRAAAKDEPEDTPDAEVDEFDNRLPGAVKPTKADKPAPDEEGEEPEDDDPEGDEPDDEADPDDEPEGAKTDKAAVHEVTIKGDDGADVKKKVTTKELIDGYMMRSDYDRKQQALKRDEQEAVKIIRTRREEDRTFFMNEAARARAVIVQLADLKSPEEMARLAQTDQGAWVAERARQEAVMTAIKGIEEAENAQKQQREQETAAERQTRLGHYWSVLGKDGIKGETVVKVFSAMEKKYGIEPERLKQIDDPRLVKIMRDAASWTALQDRKPARERVVTTAKPLPAPRQAAPRQERQQKALSERFRSGTAKTSDLASFIANSERRR